MKSAELAALVAEAQAAASTMQRVVAALKKMAVEATEKESDAANAALVIHAAPPTEVHGCNGKKRYGSLTMAGKAARSAIDARPGTQLRVYHCEFCNAFHLTSLSLESYAASREAAR